MNTIKTPQADILQSQTNAEDQHNNNSSELIEKTDVENSPFIIIGNEELGYFLAMGKYRMTQPMKTKQDVIAYLVSNTYNVIATMITTLITATNEYNTNHKNQTS